MKFFKLMLSVVVVMASLVAAPAAHATDEKPLETLQGGAVQWEAAPDGEESPDGEEGEEGEVVEDGAGFCGGSTKMPYYTTVGGIRYVTGTASQTCLSVGSAYTQELCTKIQEKVGAYWYERAPYRCNRNTGPSISTSQTVNCSTYGVGVYRVAARGKIFVVNGPIQTRYGYSSGQVMC